jgi:hypothetical protein
VRAAAIVAVLLLAGCLPIARHFPLTPPARGVYRSAGGAPVVGASLSISSRRDDRECRHPAARAVSDSLGRFVMPATTRVERVIWLVPVDPAPRPAFYLCAADEGEASAAPVAFEDVAVTPAPAPADSGAACLVARSRDGRTIGCP